MRLQRSSSPSISNEHKKNNIILDIFTGSVKGNKLDVTKAQNNLGQLNIVHFLGGKRLTSADAFGSVVIGVEWCGTWTVTGTAFSCFKTLRQTIRLHGV